MAVNKPYYRIYRPALNADGYNNPTEGYVRDATFLPEEERRSMIMAARLIIDDFERLLEYIEPYEANKNVFSHRIYELLLRTCTEVESCCKGILEANESNAYNMHDYMKIERATHLSGYTVQYTNWYPSHYSVQPFAEWAAGDSLSWYRAYNDVKHNRFEQFPKASLKNLLDAICGLLSLIYAQVGDAVKQVFESNLDFVELGDTSVSVRSFTIFPYQFPNEEKYDFEWDSLQSDPDCIQSFSFN